MRCVSGVSLLQDDAGPHTGAAHWDPLRLQPEAVAPPELPPSSLTEPLDSAAEGKSIHTNTDVIDQYALKRQRHIMRNSYGTFLCRQTFTDLVEKCRIERKLAPQSLC